MTRTEMEQARKEAEKFCKFYERVAGIHDALAVALQVQADQEGAEARLVTLRDQEQQVQAAYDGLVVAVHQLEQDRMALVDTLAKELAEGQAAQQAQLEAEAEAERLRLASTYAQLEADVALLDSLKAEASRELETVETKIAERQATLRTVQAQLQAMLVGGGA